MRGFVGDDAELVVGELQTFRAFDVSDEGRLFAVGSTGPPWTAGANEAWCARSQSHRAPQLDCTCGFYGYWSPRSVGHGAVVGIVPMWGEAVIGTHGMRAEFARIGALCLPPDVPAEIRQAVATNYPDSSIYSEVDAMIGTRPRGSLQAVRRSWPRLPRPSPSQVRALRVALAALLLAVPILGWAVPGVHLESLRGWLWLLAGVLALTSLIMRPGPISRWRELLIISPPAWLGVVVVSWLLGPINDPRTFTETVAVVAAAILIARRRHRPRRKTPIKPNRLVLDLLRELHQLAWQVEPSITQPGVLQIDSRSAEIEGRVRYLAYSAPTSFSAALRHPATFYRSVAAHGLMSRRSTIAVIEETNGTGRVEVYTGMDAFVDETATFAVREIADALGLPARAFARTSLVGDDPARPHPDRPTSTRHVTQYKSRKPPTPWPTPDQSSP